MPCGVATLLSEPVILLTPRERSLPLLLRATPPSSHCRIGAKAWTRCLDQSVESYAEHQLYIQSCSINILLKKNTHTPEYVNDEAMHGTCSTRALLITICRLALLLLHKQTRFARATTTSISSLNYLLVSSTQQSSSLREAKITLQHEVRL